MCLKFKEIFSNLCDFFGLFIKLKHLIFISYFLHVTVPSIIGKYEVKSKVFLFLFKSISTFLHTHIIPIANLRVPQCSGTLR